MISAIKEIGELISEPQIRKINGKVIFISINSHNRSYSGIIIEDFDSGKVKNYLYKEGASKGNKSVPFCPVTEPSKSFKKIEKWFEKCFELNLETDNSIISKTSNVLSTYENKIVADIMQNIEVIPKRIPKFLTIKLNGKYLGEYPFFEKCMKRIEEAKIKSSAGTGTCSVCGISGVEVSGKTDVFKFYTIDKPGFITGGFKEKLAWKNYPVCLECKEQLEKGRKFIENNLKFEFYSLSYWLIPRLLIGDESSLQTIIDILSDTNKRIELKGKIKKRITNDENEILEYLSQQEDSLTLNFLFIQKQQSAERILLLIEDIFPSRIKEIFDAKDYVDEIFAEEYNFSRLRTFFSKSSEGKRENDLDKYFLEIVDSVFRGKKVDFSFLLKFFMATIRKEFINDGYFITRVKDALMNTMFFENLGLISFEEGDMEKNIFDTVFKKYGKSFDNSARRGVFLLGALTQLLLNKQWADRNAKPFMKNLKGLRLDEKDIKALLPKIQNKLEEYDSFDKGKRLIASEASRYLLDAGGDWKMSIDEINFYFACGMNLADEIAVIVYQKTEEKEV